MQAPRPHPHLAWITAPSSMYLTPRTYASLAPSTMPACSSFPHRSPVIHAILHIGPRCGGVLAHSYVPAGMRAAHLCPLKCVLAAWRVCVCWWLAHPCVLACHVYVLARLCGEQGPGHKGGGQVAWIWARMQSLFFPCDSQGCWHEGHDGLVVTALSKS